MYREKNQKMHIIYNIMKSLRVLLTSSCGLSVVLTDCGGLCQRPVAEKKSAARSHEAACSPDTPSPAAPSCSSSQRTNTQKAKQLDAHLPSLKRRRLRE